MSLCYCVTVVHQAPAKFSCTLPSSGILAPRPVLKGPEVQDGAACSCPSSSPCGFHLPLPDRTLFWRFQRLKAENERKAENKGLCGQEMAFLRVALSKIDFLNLRNLKGSYRSQISPQWIRYNSTHVKVQTILGGPTQSHAHLSANE